MDDVDDDGDFTEPERLSDLLRELESVAILVERWIVIQHARFDYSIGGSGPHHAAQVLLNRDTREFLVRAWGKTLSRGRLVGAADLAEVCRKTLGGGTLCCPGNLAGGGPGGFAPVSHPFRRWVSKDCQVLHDEGGSGACDQSSRVKVCAHCSAFKEDEMLEEVALVKRESVGDKLEIGFAPDDESDLDETGEPDLMNPEVIEDVISRPEKRRRKRRTKVAKLKDGERAEKQKKADKKTTKCEMCGEQISSSGMRMHLVTVHLWGVFACHLCNYVLFHPDELCAHLREAHDGDLRTAVTCPSCKRAVPLEGRADALAAHYGECSVATGGTIKLTRDRPQQEPMPFLEKFREIHKKKFVCEVCGLELSSRQQLIAHTYRHTGDLPYKCDVRGCAMGFPRKASLDRHRVRHEREAAGLPAAKDVQCDKCGKRFNSKTSLNYHNDTVHEKKSMDIRCTHCHLVFPRRQQMLRHRTLVHFPETYQCDVCQKSFHNNQMLARHRTTHQPEGQFECEVCGRRIKGKTSFQDHMRVHRGEKPYACNFCSYKGSSSSLLYHHRRQTHKTELELERKERERLKVKVSAEVQLKAAQEAGLIVGGHGNGNGQCVKEDV